jgi:membrane fusion protein (multidrug efflux system)
MDYVEHDSKSWREPLDRQPSGAPRAEVVKPDTPEAFGRGKPKDKERDQEKDDETRGRKNPGGGENGADTKKSENASGEKEESEEPGKKDTEQKPQKPPFYKRPVLMTILAIIMLIVIAVAIGWWLYSRQFESTDDAFIDGHVIPISPKVAANVRVVHIDDNTHVKPGDVMIELDDRDFQVVLQQKRASEAVANGQLSQARSQLQVAQANVSEAQAEVIVAQTNADNANRDYQRFLSLDERARSKQQMDDATAKQRGSAAQVEEAKSKLKAAEAKVLAAQDAIKTSEADLSRALADVKQAELNLSYCTITAPADGLVTKKNVEPGMYLQVDQPIFSVVPTDVWVTANFKETQLDRMRIGQAVDIHIDAYPDRTFHGHVNSIQNGSGERFTLLPPENATGNYVKVVQRVPVKITFDQGDNNDGQHLLAPGLSVDPKVRIR